LRTCQGRAITRYASFVAFNKPHLVCCVCDKCQPAINTGPLGAFCCSQCSTRLYGPHRQSVQIDEGDRGNWADRWFHGTRVSKYPGINIPSFFPLRMFVCPVMFFPSHLPSPVPERSFFRSCLSCHVLGRPHNGTVGRCAPLRVFYGPRLVILAAMSKHCGHCKDMNYNAYVHLLLLCIRCLLCLFFY